MIVVSDTSAVSALLEIGRVEILRDIFGTICIPPAVSDELLRWHHGLPSFLQIRKPADIAALHRLSQTLDAGESEAILLAQELNADFLLIDELRGRQAAEKLGIRIIGLLGVLVEAKNQGFISEVKPLLDDLASLAGFRISESLRTHVLQTSGEG